MPYPYQVIKFSFTNSREIYVSFIKCNKEVHTSNKMVKLNLIIKEKNLTNPERGTFYKMTES